MINQSSPKDLLIEMFQEMVVKKNFGFIRQYYHPDFLLETNGERQDFVAFSEGHQRIYATDIIYDVRYDDEAWVEGINKVAGRVWIKTQKHGAAAVEFEVVLIAPFLDQQIDRLREVTWPDWRQAKSFEAYQSDSVEPDPKSA